MRGRAELSASQPFSGCSVPPEQSPREGAAGLALQGGQSTIPKSQLEGERFSCCIHPGEGFFPLKFTVTWLLLGENKLKPRQFRYICQILLISPTAMVPVLADRNFCRNIFDIHFSHLPLKQEERSHQIRTT